MPSSSIVLLDAVATEAENITSILTGIGYSVTNTADANEALTRAPEHNLVIVDIVPEGRTSADVCQEIRQTPALAAIPVLCISQTDNVEERIRFLEAGADDVMAKPFDARELEARVEALLLRFARTKDLSPVYSSAGITIHPQRRIIAVFSPKGGVGTTTIATNLAMVQATQHPDGVVLVDLDLQFGQVATHLNLESRQTLTDLIRDDAALREAELLRTYATRHDSGLHVLAAPPSPAFSELVTPDHVDKILSVILETYDSVVVDAGSALDERTMTVFEHADNIVLPVNPEIGALKAVHALIEYLNETTSMGTKTSFVVNGLFAREIVRLRDVESFLGTKVTAELPYDPFLYLKAVNEGIPVVTGAPKSAPALSFTRLAEQVFGPTEMPTNGTGPDRDARRGGLLGRLRRS